MSKPTKDDANLMMQFMGCGAMSLFPIMMNLLLSILGVVKSMEMQPKFVDGLNQLELFTNKTY